MIGGGGEQKTLRLVAQYADATNVFGGPRRSRTSTPSCASTARRLGRPYEEIERSTLQRIDLDAEEPAATVERFGALAEAGAQHILFSVRAVNDVAKLERIATEILDPLR